MNNHEQAGADNTAPEELRPCPWCNGKAFAEGPSLGRSHWNGVCDDCGASGPHGHDEAMAIRRWNEVANAPRTPEVDDTRRGDVTDWRPISEAPKDGTEFWALSDDTRGEDLPPFVSKCAWHPAAGFCTDELREPILWRPKALTAKPVDAPADVVEQIKPGDVVRYTPRPDWGEGLVEAVNDELIHCRFSPPHGSFQYGCAIANVTTLRTQSAPSDGGDYADLVERLTLRCADRKPSRGNDGHWFFPVRDDEWQAITALSAENAVLRERVKALEEVLQKASDHLDYCGYGDAWERECAGDLPAEIAAVLEAEPSKLAGAISDA